PPDQERTPSIAFLYDGRRGTPRRAFPTTSEEERHGGRSLQPQKRNATEGVPYNLRRGTPPRAFPTTSEEERHGGRSLQPQLPPCADSSTRYFFSFATSTATPNPFP